MPPQRLIRERELVRLLDSRCLPFLNEFEMRILAACEFGYTAEEMVVGFGKSEATVRRHLADVSHRVFDFLGIDENRPRLNHWTRRHFVCSTKEAQKMIESYQILNVR